MIPVVCSLAPGSVFFSTTVTRKPAVASACALASPPKLAPTTTQSVSISDSRSGMALVSVDPVRLSMASVTIIDSSTKERAMTLGACLCGTVRYELDGPFTMMSHCHCSMCRKHHGAPFATFVAAAHSGFRWRSGEDAVGTYASSPQGVRTHCRHCGSVGPTLLPEI